MLINKKVNKIYKRNFVVLRGNNMYIIFTQIFANNEFY